jgi:HAD superfamily hydrolase (TIGR01509 family)
MVRAIIFDCFGVLYRGSLDYLIERCPEESQAAFADLCRASDYGYIERGEFIDQASQLLGVSESDIVSIIDKSHVANEPLFELIKTLRLDYKIVLLSNIGRDVVPQLFSQKVLDELFDEVVLSSDIGVTKPFAEAYTYTAEKLGVPPSECLMIDDLRGNCDGAKMTGMQAIEFKNNAGLIKELQNYNIFIKKA